MSKTETVMAALEIMGSGMLGLFTVMVIVALSVIILNYADKVGKHKEK